MYRKIILVTISVYGTIIIANVGQFNSRQEPAEHPMSMSDSTRNLYKALQEKAKASGETWKESTGSYKSGGRRPGARKRAGGPPAKKRWRIPPAVKTYLPYALAFLAILAPLLYNPPRNNQVPPYLVGLWETDAPGYEDRYLLLNDRSLAFGTGNYTGESYIVAEIDARPVEDDSQDGAGKNGKDGKSKRMLVQIRYMKEDRLEFGLSFYYEPKPVDTITFKYQDHLKWKKKQQKKGSET